MSGVESVESFRGRARTWIRANLGPFDPATIMDLTPDPPTDDEERANVARDRELQRMLFDAGFAGLCFPQEYGGQGLTPAHQRAFNEEIAGFEYPSRFQTPTLTPCAAVILDCGTEEQKRQHLPAILRGDELWMQFLSEPSGGSDVAGALTSAVREGDEWVLNGSKIWTTGAWWSDWALCLARTNWDVPKHRGLTVFMLPIHQPGIEVNRIEMLNGSREFCQEYLTDVRVPDSDRIGEVDAGWTVGVRWMFHERMLHGSPYATAPIGIGPGMDARSLVDIAGSVGRLDDPRTRDLLGEARMLDIVKHELQHRLEQRIASGTVNDQVAAVGRLFTGVSERRRRTIAFEIAGSVGGAWTADDGAAGGIGVDFLMRQVSCIGGGTTEMARNVISERVLGMPRERSVDRDVPFREVPRGRVNG